MKIDINSSILELSKGDIINETTDAVVNAANSHLAGGGGVDGAIHRAGGPKIMEECRKIGRCPTGSAVVTSGGNLKAKFIIHSVGPVYSGKENDAKLLASSYKESLKKAAEIKAESVSFPSISTGAYGYPTEKAAEIALRTIIDFLSKHSEIKLVRMVLFSDRDYAIYEQKLKEMKNK